MIATIVLGIFSVIFASLARYQRMQWGLKASFALIFLFLALRYNFGNDYEGYASGFDNIKNYDQYSLSDFLLQYEPGWIFLNWLFKPLGFFAMTAMLAFLNCVVYYRFIFKYVPVEYYWFSVFVYVFYPDFMLVHASAMRQSVAILFFVISIDCLLRKNSIRYFFCIALASLFHYTAVILFPVYLLTFINCKIRLMYGVVIASVFLSLFVFGPSLSPYFKLLISGVYSKYEFYQDAGEINSDLGFAYYSVLFAFILYFERFQNREIALFFKVAVVGFLFVPLTLVIEIFARAGMYFMPAIIVVYPNILMIKKNVVVNVLFLAVIILVTIYQFFAFFYSDTYSEYYRDYQTFFSVPQWY